MWQALWPGGELSTPPDPDQPPPGGTPFSDRSGLARFGCVEEETHAHWHFFSAARYELDVPGAARRVADKVGFCLFDSSDTTGPVEHFPPERTWCHDGNPGGTVVRMGLSPGASDRYAAQREFQYVDMTGLAPGEYVLRGIANPSEHLVEADPADNVTEQPRVLPGVRAAGLAATVETGTALARGSRRSGRAGGPGPAQRELPPELVRACVLRVRDRPPRHVRRDGAAAARDGDGRRGERDVHARARLRGLGSVRVRGDRRARADQRAGDGRAARGAAAPDRPGTPCAARARRPHPLPARRARAAPERSRRGWRAAASPGARLPACPPAARRPSGSGSYAPPARRSAAPRAAASSSGRRSATGWAPGSAPAAR